MPADPPTDTPSAVPAQPAQTVWSCKIGCLIDLALPLGADFPMRQAIKAAFRELTHVEAEFTFSGWGSSLSEGQLAVVQDRLRWAAPESGRAPLVAATEDHPAIYRDGHRLTATLPDAAPRDGKGPNNAHRCPTCHVWCVCAEWYDGDDCYHHVSHGCAPRDESREPIKEGWDDWDGPPLTYAEAVRIGRAPSLIPELEAKIVGLESRLAASEAATVALRDAATEAQRSLQSLASETRFCIPANGPDAEARCRREYADGINRRLLSLLAVSRSTERTATDG